MTGRETITSLATLQRSMAAHLSTRSLAVLQIRYPDAQAQESRKRGTTTALSTRSTVDHFSMIIITSNRFQTRFNGSLFDDHLDHFSLDKHNNWSFDDFQMTMADCVRD